MAFDPYNYASSATNQPTVVPTAATAPFNSYAYAAKVSPEELQSLAQGNNGQTNVGLPPSGNPIQDFMAGFGEATVLPLAGSISAGYRGLWDIVLGRGVDKANQDIQSTENDLSQAPINTAEKAGQDVAQSNWNPLNWPGLLVTKAGSALGNEAERLGAPPWLSTALSVAPAAAASLLPLKGALRAGGAEADVGAGTADEAAAKSNGSAPKEATSAADATEEQRQAILERVGIKNARQSALSGDEKSAATDYQMTKFDHPAGRLASQQFEHEMDALSNHAAGIVESTGGTLGMDEDALANKGAIIDKPFSDVKNYFDNKIKSLYSAADAQAQGVPINLINFRNVLRDDSLMTNQDRVSLRNGLGSYLKQLGMVDEQPGQFYLRGNVQNAETIRKYLNAEWTPQNSRFIGQLKDAIDEDVTKAAGSDVYQQARAMRALKGQILEDPKGVSQLFETDPNTPINRSTPLEKIPSRLTNLPVDQFNNVLTILKQMPDEVQSAAQSALGEIRGYMANKLLQAGSETARNRPLSTWNGDAVSNVLKTNAAKYRLAFQDDPQSLDKISDLNKAGQILKVNTSDPGAYAQAANVMKRGIVARAISGGSRMTGAGIGGLFGAPGAAAGEVVGGAAGDVLAARGIEKSAVNAWKKRVVPIGGG